jgi:hypothetical protein
MVTLPTSLGHRCRGGAGVAWALLPPRRWHRLGIVAVVALALSLRWHCCHRRLGIVAITALASLRSLRWTSSPSWRWHHRCRRDGAMLLSRRCRHRWGQPGACAIVGIVTLASSLLSPWCTCHHRSCGAGVLADISMAPLPPSLWNRRHRCAGIIITLAPLPSLLGHCCCRGVGVLAVVAMYIITVLALAPSPVVVMALLCHHRHGDTGVIPRVSLVQLPSSQLRRWNPADIVMAPLLASLWNRCCCCAGIIVVLAPLPSLLVPRQRRGAGILAIVAMCIVAVSALAPLPLS